MQLPGKRPQSIMVSPCPVLPLLNYAHRAWEGGLPAQGEKRGATLFGTDKSDPLDSRGRRIQGLDQAFIFLPPAGPMAVCEGQEAVPGRWTDCPGEEPWAILHRFPIRDRSAPPARAALALPAWTFLDGRRGPGPALHPQVPLPLPHTPAPRCTRVRMPGSPS